MHTKTLLNGIGLFRKRRAFTNLPGNSRPTTRTLLQVLCLMPTASGLGALW